jgi:hypothetical protein
VSVTLLFLYWLHQRTLWSCARPALELVLVRLALHFVCYVATSAPGGEVVWCPAPMRCWDGRGALLMVRAALFGGAEVQLRRLVTATITSHKPHGERGTGKSERLS